MHCKTVLSPRHGSVLVNLGLIDPEMAYYHHSYVLKTRTCRSDINSSGRVKWFLWGGIHFRKTQSSGAE
jgi:hypothetical protein